jgi:hypothetical protein
MSLVFGTVKAEIAPYLMLIKLCIIIALCLGALRGGCVWQKHNDTAKVERKDAALRAAADTFGKFADTFRSIDDATRANAAAAVAQKQAADAAVVQAVADRQRQARKAASLELQLQQEKTKCIDGRRLICGVPLL